MDTHTLIGPGIALLSERQVRFSKPLSVADPTTLGRADKIDIRHMLISLRESLNYCTPMIWLSNQWRTK